MKHNLGFAIPYLLFGSYLKNQPLVYERNTVCFSQASRYWLKQLKRYKGHAHLRLNNNDVIYRRGRHLKLLKYSIQHSFTPKANKTTPACT